MSCANCSQTLHNSSRSAVAVAFVITPGYAGGSTASGTRSGEETRYQHLIFLTPAERGPVQRRSATVVRGDGRRAAPPGLGFRGPPMSQFPRWEMSMKNDFTLPREDVKGKVGKKDCNAIYSEFLKG